MIRLQSLLEDISETKPRVLFIGDSELKTSYNFAKKLMSSKRISFDSKIKFKSRADVKTLLNILDDNSELNHDLIVLFFNNLQDLKLNQVIDNLELAISIAHKHNSKIVLFTLPTLLHLTGTAAMDKKQVQIHHNINNWIRNNSNADFIIDIELDIDDAAYYESNSTTLNAEGHFFIFKQLNRYVNQIDIDSETPSTKTLDVKRKLSINVSEIEEIKQIHQILISAGYDIDKNELTNNLIGDTTKLAIYKYNSSINQTSADDINKKLGPGLEPTTTSTVTGNFSDNLINQATALLISFEGFITTAMWDVNNWRIGYGSSTITKADGSVYTLSADRSTKPTITITQEDADRDLNRRITDEFIPKVKRSLGDDTYSAWTPGTIAALTSICYNYGSIPESVVNAAKTKITSNLIAAVQALSSNKKRRKAEANYIQAAENYIPGLGDTNLKNILGGVKLLGNNIKISIPGSTAGHVGQSGWQSRNAWDIGAPVNTPVYAVNSGTLVTWKDYGPKIIQTGGKKLFGCGFTVKSDNNLPSVYYTHLKNTTVRKGSKVKVGQLLGYVMDFPGSPFDHLHIGIETGDISQFVTKDGTIKF